jgi:Flp pilus assembly protein TadG
MRPPTDPGRAARGRAGRHLRRPLFADDSGVSAVEFALVAPFLITLLLGIGDVVPSILASFQNSHATQEVGDVVSQFSQMQASDMVDAYSAATDVQGNLAGTVVNVRLTNVYSDGNGHAYVYWSCGQGALPAYTAKSAITSTPTGSPVAWFLWTYNTTANGYTLNGTNTSYVMAETSAIYTSPFQFIIKNPLTMTNTAYVLPRQSSYVGFPWDGNSNDSPAVPNATTQVASITLSNGVICSYAK